MPDEKTGVTGDAAGPQEAGEKEPASPPDAVEVVEDDPKAAIEGLKKALQAERQKRQELEAALQQAPEGEGEEEEEYEEYEEEAPAVDWDALFRQFEQTTQPAQQAQPTAAQQPPPSPQDAANYWQSFMEQFGEAINSGDPARAFQAVGAAYNLFRSMELAQEKQARQVVPQYDQLPVHDVPDEIVSMAAQNPVLLRAVLAMARAAANSSKSNYAYTEPEETEPATPLEKLQAEWKQKGAEEERQRIAKMGAMAGVTGEGAASSGETPSETYELGQEEIAFLKSLGRTDEEIAKRAQLLAEHKKQQQFRKFLTGGP